MIDRRSMIGLLLAAVGTGQAWAQSGRPPIGFLHTRTADPDTPTSRIVRQALRQLGYSDDFIIARGGEGDSTRLPDLARELAGLGVRVMIAVGPAAVRAAAETTSVPVVAVDLESDPVKTGLAAAYGRPGGRVTGLFLDQPRLAAKSIDLVRGVVPGLRQIVLLWDPATTTDQLEAATEAGRALGLAVHVAEVRGGTDYLTALDVVREPSTAAAIHLGTPGLSTVVKDFVAACLARRVASTAFLGFAANAGVLITYGVNQEDYFRRTASFVDKVLKGANPGDLPIERPDRFELRVNLSVAKAIGATVSTDLLAQADDVIE